MICGTLSLENRSITELAADLWRTTTLWLHFLLSIHCNSDWLHSGMSSRLESVVTLCLFFCSCCCDCFKFSLCISASLGGGQILKRHWTQLPRNMKNRMILRSVVSWISDEYTPLAASLWNPLVVGVHWGLVQDTSLTGHRRIISLSRHRLPHWYAKFSFFPNLLLCSQMSVLLMQTKPAVCSGNNMLGLMQILSFCVCMQRKTSGTCIF